jgi:hypothetical protein
MTAKKQIAEFTAANPNATAKEVALACNCNVKTVYNCWSVQKKKKAETMKDRIIAYGKANPEATTLEISKAIGTSAAYAYQALNGRNRAKKKAEAKVIRNDAKLLAERDREIKIMEDTTAVLLHKIEKLSIDNRLYAERETKLMGVIDYLESKVDGLAV